MEPQYCEGPSFTEYGQPKRKKECKLLSYMILHIKISITEILHEESPISQNRNVPLIHCHIQLLLLLFVQNDVVKLYLKSNKQ